MSTIKSKTKNSNPAPIIAAASTAAPITAAEEPRYRKAFAALLETIRAVTNERLQAIAMDVMTAVRTTEGVLPKVAGMRDIIAKVLPDFDLKLFDELEQRALALGHAQTVHENAQRVSPVLQSLADESGKAHDIARSEVTTLVRRGLLPAQALNSLEGGNSFRSLAGDLFKLADVLRSNCSTISGRTSMTLAELNQMEHLADQLNQALGIREQMPETRAGAARDRQAAYTLFMEAYEEVRAAVAYVRRKEGDVDSIIPSLFAGRGGSKKKAATEDTNKVTPTPTPATVAGHPSIPGATPAPVADEGTNGATHAAENQPIASAMPSDGPFIH